MKTGIKQLSMHDYLSLDALSSGVAHTLISQSPCHAKFQHEHRLDDDSNSTADIGTYAHAMLLEGGHEALVICPFDDWRKNEAKAMRDEARAAGKLPILQAKVPEVDAMVAAAKAFIATSEIAGVFDSGAAEQTIEWEECVQKWVHPDREPTFDRSEAIFCKARPDWLSDSVLLHYKTTLGSVNPDSFSRLATANGYDFAMAFYIRALNAVKPDNDVSHYILAQEQTAPYACKLFDLTAAKADVAHRQVERAINAWASCLKTGKWPAYDGHVHSIDLMPWELARAESDALTDEELKNGIPL